MLKKLLQWIQKNTYLALGYFFIWIVPLILLVFLAFESKTSSISIKLWGIVVLAFLVVIYFVALKRKIRDRVNFEKHEQLKVPVWLRLCQLLIVGVGFAICFIIVDVSKNMYIEIETYLVCCSVAVALGYIFLIVDSKKRKAQKIVRQTE